MEELRSRKSRNEHPNDFLKFIRRTRMHLSVYRNWRENFHGNLQESSSRLALLGTFGRRSLNAICNETVPYRSVFR